jgi:hypothetical protein
MRRELVFFLEGRAEKALLDALLPRLMLDPRIDCRTIAFEGKQDLEKQLTHRMRGYQNRDARFLVVRDQDSAPDCGVIKQRLVELCRAAERGDTFLVRIACRELETIYLADLRAVELAMGQTGLVSRQGISKFRVPDRLGSPSLELRTLTGGAYQKVSGSRLLGQHLDLANERSPTFKNLLGGIRKLEGQLLALPDVH